MTSTGCNTIILATSFPGSLSWLFLKPRPPDQISRLTTWSALAWISSVWWCSKNNFIPFIPSLGRIPPYDQSCSSRPFVQPNLSRQTQNIGPVDTPMSFTSLIPGRSLLPRCPRKVWEGVGSVTSRLTVGSRFDRDENA